MKVYEYIITNCKDCKYAKDIKGYYCYCRYKHNLVNISKRNTCNNFKEKK